MLYKVLVETYWNVNTKANGGRTRNLPVLVETYWNVNWAPGLLLNADG